MTLASVSIGPAEWLIQLTFIVQAGLKLQQITMGA